MAGSSRPGPLGYDRDEGIYEGTSCLAAMPAPGSVGLAVAGDSTSEHTVSAVGPQKSLSLNLQRSQQRYADTFDTYIQDEDEAHALALSLARTQGFERATNDLAVRNSRKWVGAKFVLDRLTDESRSGLAVIEDRIGPRSAADAIRSNGDILQFKSYRNWSSVCASIKRQIGSDLRRYSENRWSSGVAGISLSGRIEYQVDGDRLLRGGSARAAVERFTNDLERDLNAEFSREFHDPDGKARRTEYKIVVVFGPALGL